MLAIPSEYFHKPLAGLLYSSVAVPGQYFCTTAMMTLDNCAPPPQKKTPNKKQKQTKPTDNDISIEYVEKKKNDTSEIHFHLCLLCPSICSFPLIRFRLVGGRGWKLLELLYREG